MKNEWKMQLVNTNDAVGCVICHDITRIVKGVVKDAVFRKGHIVAKEDIPLLLSLGKDHLYVWETDENTLHEDNAAEVLRGICQGCNMDSSPVKEGKIELVASCDGMFMADVERLRALNSLGQMMVATIPSGFAVRNGQKLAGMRVIPLVIGKELMEAAKSIAGINPLLNVIPFRSRKYAVVTTGNEVFHHRIEDTFTPTVAQKLSEYGCEMIEHRVSDDDNTNIENAIADVLKNKNVELVICTGGMSVDPDDKTPLAIKNSGARIVSYGAPVLPGAMFLMGYMPDGKPICGLPGCVMYSKRTIFDLVLPRIMADIPVTAQYLAGLGHGGFCQNCKPCHFPNCSFGKGV